MHLQERGITNTNKYNCIVYDFGVISNSLASSLKEFDLVVFVTTGKSFESEADKKAIDIFNNNKIAFKTITNLSKKDVDISFVENLFDGEYRYGNYKKLFKCT